MARFTRFRVWEDLRELMRAVSSATARMRSEGDLKAQMRRAAISAASNFAEGAERGSDREFLRFLRIVDGSTAELQAQALIAMDSGCIAAVEGQRIVAQAQRIGRQVNALMAKLELSG